MLQVAHGSAGRGARDLETAGPTTWIRRKDGPLQPLGHQAPERVSESLLTSRGRFPSVVKWENKGKRQTRALYHLIFAKRVTKPSLPLAQIELIKLEKTVETFTPNHLLFYICWMWVWSHEQVDTEVRALGRMSGMEICMDWGSSEYMWKMKPTTGSVC